MKQKLITVAVATVIITQTLFSSVYATDNAVAGTYTLSVQDQVLANRATTKLTAILSGKNEAYRAKILSQLVRYRDTTVSSNPRISALLAQVINALNSKTNTNSNNIVSIDQFLNDMSEKVTTEDFRSKIAQSIYKVWWFESRNDYMGLYDSLSEFYKEVLSSRYGIKNRVSFNDNIGVSWVSFKFTPYEFINGKYVPFSSGTLAITSKPTKDDILLDASGNLIGVQVSVWLPGMVTSSTKAGKLDYGKQWTPTSVFVSKTGEIFPTFFGLVRTLSTGGGIEIREFFKTNQNKTALSIGKTQGSATDNQSKIFGKLYGIETENSIHGITAVIRNDKSEIVGTIEGVQDEKVENGFISWGFATGLVPGEEYTLEIRSTFDIKYYGMDKAQIYKTVKFRY